MRPNVPDYKSTDKPSASKLNKILAELRRLSRGSSVPPVETLWGAAGVSHRESFGRIMWAQLLARQQIADGDGHTVGAYAWQQMRELAKGNFEPEPNGFNGDFDKNTAYEINNANFEIIVGVNDIVQLFLGYRDPLKPEWLFAAPGGNAGWWVKLTARCERAYSGVEVLPRSTNWPRVRWFQCTNPNIFGETSRIFNRNIFDVNGCAFNCQGGVDPLITWCRPGGIVSPAQVLAESGSGCIPSLDPNNPDLPVPYYLIDLGGTSECDSERHVFYP